MDIATYLIEIEFAATRLISIIWSERNRLKELQREIESLSRVVEYNYRQAESWLLNAEDPDDVAMAIGIYWRNYFNEDKELYHKDRHREELANQVASHEFSVAALSEALLQYATQGISLAHGKLANCPDGRTIGSQPLKQIIWQARNQAIHWEDKNPHPPVKLCFETLAREIDVKFADYTKRNMAFDIIESLGWTDFASFRSDMLSLA